MFHFGKNFGLFIGQLKDNTFHKHYALQISVSTNSNMELSLKGKNKVTASSFFINSKVEHRLISQSNQLTILINPLSPIGHQFHLKFGQSNSIILKNKLTNRIIKALSELESDKIDFNHLSEKIEHILNEYQCNCLSENHLDDQRIFNAIKYMDANFEKVLSLEEVAEKCFLSPTRFSHLFKEKTNLTFRRYQLWNRLVKSLPYLVHNSVSEATYTFGFSDNSHYTRTFKETFGVTPKFLKTKL